MVSRFFEWMLAPLIFVWLVSFGSTFFAARASVDKAHDARLIAISARLDVQWQEAKQSMTPNNFPSSHTLQWLSMSSTSPYRYAIVDEWWSKLSGDDEVADAARYLPFANTRSDELEQSNVMIDGVMHRTIKLSNATRETIVIAHNRQEDDALIRSIVLFEAIPQAMILLMAGFLVAYGLAYVAKPLAQIQTLLEQRSANSLDPIQTTGSYMPQELEPFLNGVNDLLQRLDLAIRAQRRFIADAAHQLRTPIAAMLNDSQLLARLTAQADIDAAIIRLQVTSDRTSRLITQLLSMARAESSAVSATFEVVDLCQLAQLIAVDSTSSALDKNIDFALDLQQKQWLQTADATLIGEMIRNLIDNAFCYTPMGGQVILSLNASMKQISIDDSGPGIALEERSAVFAPFYRGRNLSQLSRVSGSGLGLAIVNEVAMLHNAGINVESSALGGARLVVSFR
jgi:two-component system, OmpR family, sensor histidine kinase TctE